MSLLPRVYFNNIFCGEIEGRTNWRQMTNELPTNKKIPQRLER